MFWKRMVPVLLLLVGCVLIEGGLTANYSEARSMSGGRSFRSTPYRAPSNTYRSAPNQSYGNQSNKGSFGRGLAGGLLGGALGGLLFGSMFGMGGSGMGILPLLLLAGVAYFIFKKMSQPRSRSYGPPYGQSGGGGSGFPGFPGKGPDANQPPPPPPPYGSNAGGGFGQSVTPDIGSGLQEDGMTQIRRSDPGFDEKHFLEVASDVFFQVQAGWMRRDLSSYKHLLGEQLASEYDRQFAEMKNKGHINKLESIAIRNVEIVSAGSEGGEDFVTVLFTANLLDYTVDDQSGALVSGSMTEPVKFREEWTWARPVGTQNWKLEGIKVA